MEDIKKKTKIPSNWKIIPGGIQRIGCSNGWIVIDSLEKKKVILDNKGKGYASYPAALRAAYYIYNKDAYMADDGHYYPGLGFAQWTGQRAKNLLDFARDNNLDWSTPATQLAFLNSELETGYGSVRDSVNETSTPESAADTFCRSYEGYNRSDGIAVRQSHARSIYNQFDGKYDEES